MEKETKNNKIHAESEIQMVTGSEKLIKYGH